VRPLGDRFSNAEAVQRGHRVRKQDDARPARVDAWRPLEDDDVMAGAA
jgi:hypothetical protein